MEKAAAEQGLAIDVRAATSRDDIRYLMDSLKPGEFDAILTVPTVAMRVACTVHGARYIPPTDFYTDLDLTSLQTVDLRAYIWRKTNLKLAKIWDLYGAHRTNQSKHCIAPDL